jgi:hypothetical protein
LSSHLLLTKNTNTKIDKTINLLLVLDGKPKSRRPPGMIILKYVINNFGVEVWTGFIWLSTSTTNGLFLIQEQTARFHKRQDT